MTDTPDADDTAAVTGELVSPPEAAVIPSDAEVNAAADRARGRTTIQVGIPSAIVGLGVWLLRLFDVDLDPGPGRDIPADVAGYFVAIVTVLLAVRMNPKRK